MKKRKRKTKYRGIDIQAKPATRPADDDDYWYSIPNYGSSAGVDVSPESALHVSAVYASVRVLAETLASLPLPVYMRLVGGGKEKAYDHPLYDLLHDRPNTWQTSFEWREMMMGHLVLRGNAYSRIISGLRGVVDQLWPLHPDRVKVERIEGNRLLYKVTDEKGISQKTLLQEEVFHLRGFSTDGMVGIGPIQLMAEGIGLSIATEKYGALLFSNRAMPGGVLEHPGKIGDKAQKNLRNTWHQPGLAGAHKTALLEEGMKWHQLGLTNEDAQFLETRKFQVNEIARIFRIPPHMIGDLEKATFSNIEHQSIDFVVHTIRPWLVRWEQAISRDLIQFPRKYFAEFLVDGLLRGDAQARSIALQTQFRNGALTINEWREFENRNPLPNDEGKKHYVDIQLQEVGVKPGPLSGTWDTPQETQEPEEDTDKDDTVGSLNDNMIDIFVEDAAERLTHAESRELQKRIHKASEDRDKFNEWIEDVYKTHYTYACKVVSPLARAYSDFDIENVLDSLGTYNKNRIITADCPETVLQDIIENGIAQAVAIIKKGFSDGNQSRLCENTASRV